MKTFYAFACALLLSSFSPAQAQDDTPLGAGVRGGNMLMKYLNYEGLKRGVTERIEKDKKTWYEKLAKSGGEGILFDVPVYEFEEGHWTDGPYRLGQGKTPLLAAMPQLEHAYKHGTIANNPKTGYMFSAEQSYMVWVTAEGNTVKMNTVSGASRQVFYEKIAGAMKAKQ